MQKEEYAISIERAGVADLPELCRAQAPELAAEVVRALLSSRDPLIQAVHIAVVRMHAG